jgi:hypothetical protein
MITNRQLILPYAAPYLAYVGIASLPVTLVTTEINYLFRLTLVPLLIVWAWRWYCPLRGPRAPLGSILAGIAAGLVGLFLWIGLLTPFVHAEGASPWSWHGFLLRLVSAGLVVPLFEELMMRGFALRLALQWHQARTAREPEPLHIALDQRSINDVAAGAWSWPAVLLSTAAFTAGHAMAEWPAAVAYGLLMAWLWVSRKDLIACITAHAVTNIALALFVHVTGSWHFW